MPGPKPGTAFTFKGEPDDDGNIRALGDIQPDTVVTVREYVTADTPGAHNDREDAVVLETEQMSVGFDDDGEPVVVRSQRAFSVSADYFSDNFTKGA